MGAAGSKADETGIITVISGSKRGASSGEAEDPLLLHLRQLQAAVPSIDAALLAGSSASATAAAAAASRSSSGANKPADPESLLGDVELAKQLATDNQQLNASVTTLITSYQDWHNDNVKALTTNQDYIARTIDQAETKADKAVRHVLQQTTRLKHLAAGLADAATLPGMLADLTASTAALEQQLAQLEQLAAGDLGHKQQRKN